jgi:creatinine amidohydrolase
VDKQMTEPMTSSPHATKKVRMGEITAGEARALYARNPVVLLPMGSHEDQGPHAPMGDYLSAERVAELIARRATEGGVDTVVAPVIPFGGADYFGAMPGGIALTQATLRAVITDMLACLLRHGLTRIIVINGHGGNVQAINETTQLVYRERKIIIPSLYLWSIGYALLPGILGAEKSKLAAGHGADPLTSVVMHLFPELIRADMVPAPGPLGKVMGLQTTSFGAAVFEGMPVALPVEYDEVVPDAVRTGDPRLCSAETGAALVEKLTDLGARFVRHYVEHTS